MDRNQLRALTLGAPKTFKSELFEVETPSGKATFEIRMPTVLERQRIQDDATIVSKDQKVKDRVDLAKFEVLALVALVFVPLEDADGNPKLGGTVRAYEKTDVENLLAQPIGGWSQVLARKAFEMLGSTAEAMGKGFATTAPSDSSPSSP